jgi:hypothetical protein
VLGPVRDERDEAPTVADTPDASPEPREPAEPEPTAVQAPVPLIDDSTVSGGGMSWDPAGGERKPLLTRAQPLDARGRVATWAMRVVALLVLVAVVVAVLLLVAGGGL